MKLYEAENNKLKANYEIIKEHEMSVIRDCERRKMTELKEIQDNLQLER